jgi:DNA-binding transcriptional LysR family regulator
MADLTLVGLRILRAVADGGSFTAAAASLGYTQSAVSRKVGARDAAAGAPLFERAPRGVRVTEAGRVLLGHAAAVLDQVGAAERDLAGLRTLASGRVRLGAFATSVAALVPRAVAAFRARHPGVSVALREGISGSLLRRVVSGSADLAVVGALPGSALEEDDRVAVEPLMEDPLLLAVGLDHPLARRRIVDVDSLAAEVWVAGSTDPKETLLGAWRWSSWEPEVRYVAREWTAKLGLVAAGLGVTLVPSLAATAVRRDVALLRLRSDQPATRSIFLATRARADASPAATALAEALHETAAELAVDLQRRAGGR